MSRRAANAALALAIQLILGACGGPVPPIASASADASPVPTIPSPSGSATSGSAVATPAVVYDESLVAILPVDVDGLPVTSTPDAAADLATDPAIAAAAERVAFGVVVDPGGELSVAAVVALRPGVFGDDFWRDWRDSYDEGACAQAGGVVGRAEAQIAGRTVYIGSCGGGARTYHAYLPQRDVVVSVTAVGEDTRLGERLMEELRP